ncbi:hypothetical protein FACS1894174_00500 [Bacteroidia bacterium]|nr:hypothetical protein FACS1894174_00500 [Bacteroidia bacterium]
MNIENVEKKKRGRKPKAEPQRARLMIRLNDKDRERFLQMYEKSGMKSYSAFITDCVLNSKPKVTVINKSTVDFVMLLSSFFKQFRAVKNNFNQAYYSLVVVVNFGEAKALEMIQIVAQSTREFGLLKKRIEETIIELRELCLPK